MSSLLNSSRPPVFCPGCSHERMVHALDAALQQLGIQGDQVVLVTDIGCSGLFDVFFHTHAFHGLHGRALTYALGLKMAKPEMHVIVTMGDGGMGIGGAHLLSSCRRNTDMTLLVLNNFNFGMTGGQYSATTPQEGVTSSRFLNQLEAPLDICRVADAAGAPFVMRCSGLEKDIVNNLAEAISYTGFSVVDVWGICPGRYSRANTLSPKTIREKIGELEPYAGVLPHNQRQEYCSGYFAAAAEMDVPSDFVTIEQQHEPPLRQKLSVMMLGSAGQRVVTAGELLSFAGMSGGMKATQKNDYDITVLKGPSVSEIILWPGEVGYSGIECPDVVLVLSEDGVKRRKDAFGLLGEGGLVVCAGDVDIPRCSAEVVTVDYAGMGISSQNRALASLGVLARINRVLTPQMLDSALRRRFTEKQYQQASQTLGRLKGE